MHHLSPKHARPTNYDVYRRQAEQLRREAYNLWIDAALMRASMVLKAVFAARWRATAKPAPRVA